MCRVMRLLRSILTAVLLAVSFTGQGQEITTSGSCPPRNDVPGTLSLDGVGSDVDSTSLRGAERRGNLHNNEVDVSHVLFGHIGDSYGWHITDWKGNHVTIPLPCIVYSRQSGWHAFMSSKIEHGHSYKGFALAEEGRYADKIVEVGPDGSQVRPFDISITKNVASLMFTAVLLITLVLLTRRWYERNDARDKAPGGFVGLMEMMVMMVHDDIIKDAVGPEYRKYAPYLLTVFFFIFISNLLGIVPFFPGGANVTGNIAVTMVLALCTFFAVNMFANKHYWKEILWPDVPLLLKFPIPLMQMIEIFGMFTKPFSLMVRLFANILAGHAMIM